MLRHLKNDYHEKQAMQKSGTKKNVCKKESHHYFSSPYGLGKLVTKIKCKYLEMLGFEPRASYMQSKRSTAELHPQLGSKSLSRQVRF